ncbi:DUF1826 domain-containing protein [Leptospira bouyouniensis]|uniref:DUF1826 domain-containing protein n=1 Tax=Leptospira bouyouniensis TaxID=2484911 RepID=A0ABY2L1G5_9LEPT|nr:DUF1826 domain-containing protein [Leptospira bouyouniensis]TGK47117.1 DUF1826 domain-containing protein [Leptospira bouyouniensis]
MHNSLEVVESFRISSQIEVFNEIQRKGVNVSIWKRRPSKNIIKYLDSIINNKNFSFEIDAEDVDRVEHFLPIHNNISNLEFANEIKKLSSIFANITYKKHHTIQITTVNKMQCPLFHVDFLSYRMMCTYKGPGTLWIPNSSVDRSHLGCGRNNHVIQDFRLIRETENFDVILMKGDLHPDDPNNGCIHKSPEVLFNPRIFLKID